MAAAPKQVTSPYGNKPKNLPDPRPNVGAGNDAAMAAEATANALPAAASTGNPAPAPTDLGSLDDTDLMLLARAKQGAGTGAAAPQEPGLGAKALDATVRVADYPGGFVRSGLANVAGLATGKTDVVTPEDLKNAAVGKAPSSEEYLRRLGVGEGGSFDVAGVRLTSRGAAGLALDIATDPLTAIAKTVRAIPYLEKVIGAPGRAAEALGTAVYKSAVAAADAKVARKAGKAITPIGDALVEAGMPIGNAAKLDAKVRAFTDTMGNMRQALYDRATQLGVTIDAGYPLRRAEAVLANMREIPTMRAAADDLQNFMEIYKKEGVVSIDKISKWKSQLYDALPASAWGVTGKLKGPAKQFKAALAADFKDAVVGAGNKAEKGLGDAIDKLNERWGQLLDAPMIPGAATQGSLGHAIDGAVLAVGGIPGLIKKKGYDLATGKAARTAVGKAIVEAGKRDIVNRTVRQGLAESQRPPVAPDESGQ